MVLDPLNTCDGKAFDVHCIYSSFSLFLFFVFVACLSGAILKGHCDCACVRACECACVRVSACACV